MMKIILEVILISCAITYIYTAIYLFCATRQVNVIGRRIVYCLLWPYTIPKSYKLYREEREREIQQARIDAFMGR